MDKKRMDLVEYSQNSWEYAATRIIVQHEMDIATSGKADYPKLFDSGMFAVLARTAWQELRDNGFDWDIDSQVGLLASKQHDYGHDNILKFGTQGVLVRLWDKISRYQNLVRRGVEPENESVADTLVDMIGYSVIWFMLKNGTFTNQLQEDLF